MQDRPVLAGYNPSDTLELEYSYSVTPENVLKHPDELITISESFQVLNATNNTYNIWLIDLSSHMELLVSVLKEDVNFTL